MPELPSPLRAAVGLAVVLVDEAKRLPDRVLEVPMMAISRALQLSLRAQQQYAALAARGDEVLSSREITEEPPEWATFDDAPVGAPDELPSAAADASTVRGTPRAGKSVRAPRGAAPSAFDIVADPDADAHTDDVIDLTDRRAAELGALSEEAGDFVPDTD